MTIVNDDSRAVNKLEASLTDYARVVIYDQQMFIVQATDLILSTSLFCTYGNPLAGKASREINLSIAPNLLDELPIRPTLSLPPTLDERSQMELG
jgi:hypothetical protein